MAPGMRWLSTRTPYPPGGSHAVTVPGEGTKCSGSSALMRHSIACPRSVIAACLERSGANAVRGRRRAGGKGWRARVARREEGHAAPASARGRLDHEGVAGRAGERRRLVPALERPFAARDAGGARLFGHGARLGLV